MWALRNAYEEFDLVQKDNLYRCLDKLLAHKTELFSFLQQRWKTLFDAKFEVLLYDLTSTYFECDPPEAGKRRHGYSRDKRSDCVQVVIALIVTPDGLPLAYEVMPGNTSDKTTLRDFPPARLRRADLEQGAGRVVDSVGLREGGNVAELIGGPGGAIARCKQKRNPAIVQKLGDRIAQFAGKIDVQDREVDGGLLCQPQSRHEPGGNPGDRVSELEQVILQDHRPPEPVSPPHSH